MDIAATDMLPGGTRLTRLIARDFRNHVDLDLSTARRFVALVGENGAGKTNVLDRKSVV